MRIVLVIAAVAALGACSKPAEEAAAPATTAAAAEAAPAAAAIIQAGEYTFVDKDKKQGTLSIAADTTTACAPSAAALANTFSENALPSAALPSSTLQT